MNFRAIWEHPNQVVGGTGASAAFDPVPTARGSFGPGLPAAVQTIRIVFESARSRSCCLAVTPANVPVDPVSGGAFLVLDSLPAGPASVSIAGFPTAFVPAPPGITDQCPTVPAGVGQACDRTQLATPSFESAPHSVNIIGGAENDAGDIEVLAVPFLLRLDPAPAGSASNPVPITFVVADAASGIDRGSVTAEVRQSDGSTVSIALTLTPCDDNSSAPCSDGTPLHVTGFLAASQPRVFSTGATRPRIRARNLSSPPDSLDFAYEFTARGVPVFTTPTSPRFTPTPSEPVTVIVGAGANLTEAAMRLPPGSTIIVSPGTYGPIDLGPGDLRGPITFIADTTGTLTNSAPAAAVINARGRSTAIRLVEQADVVIDGFTIRGGAEAGVLAVNSPRLTLRHSFVIMNNGDGVRVNQSDGVLLLNDAIADNDATGVSIAASNAVRVINNTVYKNGRAGIEVTEATDTEVTNNIFDENGEPGMVVDPSSSGFQGDFNLNTDGYRGTEPGLHDIIGKQPLFIFPSGQDFHLQAFPGGTTSPAVDSGDPNTDSDLAAVLAQRSAQADGMLDVPPVDMGYHYLPPPAPPTARPRPTQTPTPSPTATRRG